MIWICGWPFIFLHLYVPEPYKEMIIALQTFICAFLKKQNIPLTDSILAITLFVILTYFTQTEHIHQNVITILLHHTIVGIASISNYIINDWRYILWCILCWSIRWLSSINIYQQSPIRASVRIFMFFLLSRKPFGDPYRWYWILLVHEIVWVLCYVLRQVGFFAL
jgi:hypothetical protein